MARRLMILILFVILFYLISSGESSYGSSWTLTTAPSDTWWSVSSDSTGEIIYAAQSLSIYYSTNYGSNWSKLNAPVPSPTTVSYLSVASSSNGAQSIACEFGGYVYITTGNNYSIFFIKFNIYK